MILNDKGRAALTRVAEWLERGAPHEAGIGEFNMNMFLSPVCATRPACGTICCLAGALVQFDRDARGLDPLPHDGDLSFSWIERLAREAVGVADEDDAAKELHALFWGYINDGEDDVDLANINTDQAAVVVRHLLATGEVKWELVAEDGA